MTWHDMAWHDMIQHDMTWLDMAWNDITWNDITWHDMTIHDMTWHDMTWHDMKRHDMTNDYNDKSQIAVPTINYFLALRTILFVQIESILKAWTHKNTRINTFSCNRFPRVKALSLRTLVPMMSWISFQCLSRNALFLRLLITGMPCLKFITFSFNWGTTGFGGRPTWSRNK